MLNAIDRDEQVPCASLLKPLYAWMAHEADPVDVMASIRVSDNAATDRVVAAGGGLKALLFRLETWTGVDLRPATTWGQVRVSAEQAETAYDKLFRDAAYAPAAGAVVEHMRHVVDAQRFGAPAGVPVKAGWDVEAATGQLLVHVALRDDDGHARVVCTRNEVSPGMLPDPFEGEPALAVARFMRGYLAHSLLGWPRHTR